jgi:hypothetical protein
VTQASRGSDGFDDDPRRSEHPTDAAAVPGAAPGDRWWRGVASVLAALGVLWWTHTALAAAMLPYEDGTWLFARHFQEVRPSMWFDTWAGYVSVLPNVLASLLCLLPVPCVPHAFAATAVLLTWIALTCFLDPRFDSVAPVRLRASIVVAWAWLPLSDWIVATSLMYSLLPALLWLTLVLLRPAQPGRPSLCECAFVVIATWSQPLAFALMPISVSRLRERAARPIAVTHLVAAVAYWFLGRVGGEPLHWERLALFPAYTAARVGYETFATTASKAGLVEAGRAWVVLAVGGVVLLAVVVGASLAWRRWSATTRRFVLGLAWLFVTSIVAMLLLRDEGWEELWTHRYPLPARLALVAVGFLAAGGFMRRPWLLLAIVPIVVWIARCDYRFSTEDRTPEFAAFLQDVAEQERASGGRQSLDVRFERRDDPRWSIQLRPR